MLNIDNIHTKSIKQSNRSKILNLVYKNRDITKQEIAKVLNLSIPTVISNVNLLIDEGILEESGVAASTGGRKPVIVRLVKDSKYSFGVDISPDETRIILTNLYAEIKADVAFNHLSLKNINDIMGRVEERINDILDKHKIPKESILGIGFSLPGIVNEELLYLENAPNIGIKDINFSVFQKRLGIKIYIENDGNTAALAESVIGIAKSKSNLVYLQITEGIGAGIVINGHLYRGQNKKAGEIGHMRISDEGLICNCGRTGCWELYASEKALLRIYNDRADSKVQDLEGLFEKYFESDKLAKDSVNRYLDHLVIGIQNIILAFAPEYVIIGGKISCYEDVLLEPLTKRVLQESIFLDRYNTQIIFSRLKQNASILGSALLPLKELFK